MSRGVLSKFIPIRRPFVNLHRSLLRKALMHIKSIPQQMWLVTHALFQTVIFRYVEVLLKNGPVVRMRALFNNDTRPFLWRESTNIGEALSNKRQNQRRRLHAKQTQLETAYLLRNHDIQIVLGLINMRTHRHNATHSVRVRLAPPRTGRVHNAVFSRPQEVGRSAQAIQHPAPHDTSAVCVGVNVHLDGRVHADDAQPADNLRRVADLLRAQDQLGRVRLPSFVEALEALWAESDRRRRCKVQMAAVEQIQEGVLQNLRPHFEVAELGAASGQTADDSVGDVADAGLNRQKALWEAATGDFVLEEFDEIRCDSFGRLVFRRIRLSLIWVVGFDNSNNSLRIHWNMWCSDSILGRHDEIGLPSRRKIGHCDVVQTLKAGSCGIDLDDDLPND